MLSSYSSALMSERQRKRKLQENPSPDSKLLKDNVSTALKVTLFPYGRRSKVTATPKL